MYIFLVCKSVVDLIFTIVVKCYAIEFVENFPSGSNLKLGMDGS